MQQYEGGVDHAPAQDPGRVNEDRLALRLAAFSVVVKPLALEELLRQIQRMMMRLDRMRRSDLDEPF